MSSSDRNRQAPLRARVASAVRSIPARCAPHFSAPAEAASISHSIVQLHHLGRLFIAESELRQAAANVKAQTMGVLVSLVGLANKAERLATPSPTSVTRQYRTRKPMTPNDTDRADVTRQAGVRLFQNLPWKAFSHDENRQPIEKRDGAAQPFGPGRRRTLRQVSWR